MSPVLVAGEGSAQTFAVVRAELGSGGGRARAGGRRAERAAGHRGGDDRGRRRAAIGRGPRSCSSAMAWASALRRDAYLLWELGIPVVFAITGAGAVATAAQCGGFATGLGRRSAPCVSVGSGDLARARRRRPWTRSPRRAAVAAPGAARRPDPGHGGLVRRRSAAARAQLRAAQPARRRAPGHGRPDPPPARPGQLRAAAGHRAERGRDRRLRARARRGDRHLRPAVRARRRRRSSCTTA